MFGILWQGRYEIQETREKPKNILLLHTPLKITYTKREELVRLAWAQGVLQDHLLGGTEAGQDNGVLEYKLHQVPHQFPPGHDQAALKREQSAPVF